MTVTFTYCVLEPPWGKTVYSAANKYIIDAAINPTILYQKIMPAQHYILYTEL